MTVHTIKNSKRAFTLVEILIVVVILGILAASIIPQFMSTKNDAKISAAKANIAELDSALERFYVHMDRYPSAEEGLKVLVDPPTDDADKKWRGPYIKQLRNDPWGHPYQYRYPGTHHTSSFDIASQGDGSAEIGNW
ncbi:MAG TPA: type II secretion system major pseudopilin GspG [Verrucomicrobiae bacterium]|nr:type II secretion system major pseudopilin GspG [Verrucomicrobiae bacterium]